MRFALGAEVLLELMQEFITTGRHCITEVKYAKNSASACYAHATQVADAKIRSEMHSSESI